MFLGKIDLLNYVLSPQIRGEDEGKNEAPRKYAVHSFANSLAKRQLQRQMRTMNNTVQTREGWMYDEK